MWAQSLPTIQYICNTLRRKRMRRRKYACLVAMFVFVPFSSHWRDKCVCLLLLLPPLLLLWTNFHVPTIVCVECESVHRCVHCLPSIHIEKKRISENLHRGRISIFFDTRQYWCGGAAQRKDKYLISFIYVRMYVWMWRAQATCAWVWRNAITILFDFNALQLTWDWVHCKRIHQFVLNTHTFTHTFYCKMYHIIHTHSPTRVVDSLEIRLSFHLLFENWTRVFL